MNAIFRVLCYIYIYKPRANNKRTRWRKNLPSAPSIWLLLEIYFYPKDWAKDRYHISTPCFINFVMSINFTLNADCLIFFTLFPSFFSSIYSLCLYLPCHLTTNSFNCSPIDRASMHNYWNSQRGRNKFKVSLNELKFGIF